MTRINLFILVLSLPLIATRGCGGVETGSSNGDDPVSGVNYFGINVYKGIFSPEQVLLSPLSLSTALAMTAQGASAGTEAQMKDVLGFKDLSDGQMSGFYQRMLDYLSVADSNVTLNIANSIWTNRHIKIHKSFTEKCRKQFGAEARSEDFSNPETLQKINGWCSDNTSGRIPSILDKLDDGHSMLLLNALYFQGNWKFSRFNVVSPGDFTDINGSVSVKEMMSVRRSFDYTCNEYFQIVELPYGNGDFVMDILLPAEGVGLEKAVKTLDAGKWDRWMDDLAPVSVMLRMPKFKMECEAQLADVVAGLGMSEAFSANADFSKISDTPMRIDFIKQKTFIDVNEEGTEAAAVTAVGMKATSVGPTETLEMNVDHPFIFTIREKTSGLIFFIGHYTGIS